MLPAMKNRIFMAVVVRCQNGLLQHPSRVVLHELSGYDAEPFLCWQGAERRHRGSIVTSYLTVSAETVQNK